MPRLHCPDQLQNELVATGALKKTKGRHASSLFSGEEPLANERRYSCSNQLSYDKRGHMVDCYSSKRCRKATRNRHCRIGKRSGRGEPVGGCDRQADKPRYCFRRVTK